MPKRKICGLRSSAGSSSASGTVKVFLQEVRDAPPYCNEGYSHVLGAQVGLGKLRRKLDQELVQALLGVLCQHDANVPEPEP